MTTETLTAAVVQQPIATEPQTGLLQSARVLIDGSDRDPSGLDGDDRWVFGVSYRPEDCDFGTGLAMCGDGTGTDVTAQDCVNHFPMIVEAESDDVSSFVTIDAQEELDRVRRKLLRVRSYQLERELWTGALAATQSWTDNQRLSAATYKIEGGAPLGTLVALAELEQYLAEHSTERGMIHAQPRTVIYWLNNGAVTQAPNGLITSALGTIIVPGRGYPGSGPTAAPNATVSATNADKGWAYATGMVYVRLGAITYTTTDQRELFTRSTNRWHVRAHQPATANFSPCALGAAYINHNVAERTTTGS